MACSRSLHLHVPGVTGTGDVCSKSITRVTPLNAGDLKVYGDTHGTKPMKFQGGEVGLEKQTLKIK